MNQQNPHLPSPPLDEIEKAVNIRAAAGQKIEQALDLIREAIEIAPQYTFETFLRNHVLWYDSDFEKYKKKAYRVLDKRLWRHLLDKSKLGAVINAEQLAKIENDIEQNPAPLTAEVARATFMELFSRREESFKEGLVNVLRSLSGNYRSHDPFKVKKRLILNRAMYNGYLRYDYSGRLFDDFTRYIYLLQGVDPTAIAHKDLPRNVINDNRHRGQDDFDFGPYRVKTFGNGNLHIWIEDEELLNKINKTIADYYKNTLAAAYAQK